MPTCPSCQAVNPAGNRFCGRCGAPVAAMECGACGHANPEGQAFCGRCGSRVDGHGESGSDQRVEERKLATVLFADVVGFTSLAERTDPEVLSRIVDAAFVELGRVVAEHGGTVDKYMGDSLMAVFGVPSAHDDDAERAVAAALAMRRLGGDLVFSIGVNSGEVMAASVGRGDFTVMGDTVNVAARLEKAAGPGEVLCGGLTAELAGRRIEFHERQPVLLKGKREPVAVWEALRVRRSGDAGVLDAPCLVGRQDEWAFLDMHWRRVRDDGQAKLVVLCGDAGSGKTRLLDELAGVAAGHATVVRAAYPAYGLLGGVHVATELIEQLGPSRDPEVESRVRSVAGEMLVPLKDMDATGVRREQLWALARLLKEKAEDLPLVIMIDDLHWGDERTLELLAEVSTRMRETPILTVVAGRTDPGGWLGRFAAATSVRLSPLNRAHAAELAQMLVGDKPLDVEACDFLVDMAGGNPMYLRELVSMARDRAMLVDVGDRYTLTSHSGIPATLQALLAARLDSLERSRKTVMQYIAVLGEASQSELMGLGLEPGEAELGSLVDDGLLRLDAEGRYITADPLLREVAYEMLPRNLRGELHRRAATLVEAPEERVRHLERAAEFLADDAELGPRAAEALADQGEELARSSLYLDALRVLEKAVTLGIERTSTLLELARMQTVCNREADARSTLSRVPDDPSDPAVAVERDHQVAATQMFIDPAWAAPKLAEAAIRWHDLGNSTKEAWAYANCGAAHFYMSQMDESARLLEKAWSMFEALGDRTSAVSTSSFLCLARPTDPRVETWLAEALELADDSGDRWRQIGVLTSLTWKHFFRSFGGTVHETAELETFGSRLAHLADELGTLDIAMHAWGLLALSARLTGRFEEARSRAAELQRLALEARSHGDPWLAWAVSFSVAVATGATGAAAPFPPSDSVDPVVNGATLIVIVELLLSGRVEEALAEIGRLKSPSPAGPLTELLASMALLLIGDSGRATAWVERAATISEQLSSAPAARAAAALAAEIRNDVTGLPALTSPAGGIADVLVLRALARSGDDTARARLSEACATLSMPGLMLTD